MREYYSAVRLIAHALGAPTLAMAPALALAIALAPAPTLALTVTLTLTLDLRSLYGLSDFDLREHWEAAAELSPLGFCDALALKKGYRIARGRGGADTHRAGLEVRRDCYAQPESPDHPNPNEVLRDFVTPATHPST